MRYNVFGHIIASGTKTHDTVEANTTRQAIIKAYDNHGKYYTMDKVFNEDCTLLMADDLRIYNR